MSNWIDAQTENWLHRHIYALELIYGDLTLTHFGQHRKLSLAAALLLGMLCAAAGCHRRGYTDLYLESMATEVRELEDQLYEYDHEYKLLEQELEGLRRQNAALKRSSGDISSSSRNGNSQMDSRDSSELPAPKRELEFDLPSRIPELNLPKTLPPQGELPDRSSRNLERIEPEPVEDASPIRQSPTANHSEDFDVEELTIPSIITGSKSPPMLKRHDSDTAPESDLEMSLSQIEMPSHLASTTSGATILPATQVVVDKKVVELAFHPALTRSVNFDDDQQDDGLFLVLQPKNASGQFVNVPAALTVEILDPAREDGESKIGVWRYSPSEVAGKMQPIGSQQGIHLTLPWNGPNPKADRVVVFVTYTFENGRQVIGHREVFVQNPGSLKTVWAPRAPKSFIRTNSSDSPSVLPASGHRQSDSSFLPVSTSRAFPPSEPPPQP